MWKYSSFLLCRVLKHELSLVLSCKVSCISVFLLCMQNVFSSHELWRKWKCWCTQPAWFALCLMCFSELSCRSCVGSGGIHSFPCYRLCNCLSWHLSEGCKALSLLSDIVCGFCFCNYGKRQWDDWFICEWAQQQRWYWIEVWLFDLQVFSALVYSLFNHVSDKLK